MIIVSNLLYEIHTLLKSLLREERKRFYSLSLVLNLLTCELLASCNSSKFRVRLLNFGAFSSISDLCTIHRVPCAVADQFDSIDQIRNESN